MAVSRAKPCAHKAMAVYVIVQAAAPAELAILPCLCAYSLFNRAGTLTRTPRETSDWEKRATANYATVRDQLAFKFLIPLPTPLNPRLKTLALRADLL
jgi:hypothetical protein